MGVTKLLHMDGGLERCYDRTFAARVVEVRPDWVMLDQTLFYPEGGGQPWDVGTLSTADGRTLNVTEVTKRGPVKHVVGQDHGLVAGQTVQGQIDWTRRYAHMRMHTAQHLVSGLAYEMFKGARTVGNQIHAERSRIDLNPIDFTPQMLKDLETASNDAIRAGHAVTVGTMTRDAVNSELPPERSNLNLLPASVNELRVIRIGSGIDLCPCAGTHVRSTRELGEVRIVGRQSKGSGTQRIEYVLEGGPSPNT